MDGSRVTERRAASSAVRSAGAGAEPQSQHAPAAAREAPTGGVAGPCAAAGRPPSLEASGAPLGAWGAVALDVAPWGGDAPEIAARETRAAWLGLVPLGAGLDSSLRPPGAHVAGASTWGLDPAPWVPGQSAGIVERAASDADCARPRGSAQSGTIASSPELRPGGPFLPSVHTQGISQQVTETIGQLGSTGGGAPVWLAAELEARTAAARAAAAARHLEAARKATTLARYLWHRRRARGAAERWLRVARCGRVAALRASCRSCDHDASVRPIRCGSSLGCDECRRESIRATRAVVQETMARASADYSRELAAGWGWRLVTVTLPHAGIGVDTATIGRAWSRMWRSVDAYVRRENPGAKRPRYIARIEVTPSGGGHVHMHALVLSPYLPHEALRVWWAKAHGRTVPMRSRDDVYASAEHTRPETLDRLLVTRRGKHGRPLTHIPWPVIDIRAAGADVSVELVKYVVKDSSSCGELIRDPAYLADVYTALQSRRVTRSSRGFLCITAPHEPHCRCCGEVGSVAYYVTRVGSPRVTRGPPITVVEGCS